MTQTKHYNCFSNPIDPDSRTLDRHHLLWCRRRWTGQPFEELRGLTYLIVYIPKDSLHKLIHRKIRNGITPPPEECAEEAYRHLVRAKDRNELRFDHDTPMERLQRLIEFWQEVPEAAQTVDGLKYEQELCAKYFAAENGYQVAKLFAGRPPKRFRQELVGV